MFLCFIHRERLILFCLFHELCKSVIFDDGFHPVEGFQVDNNCLFPVPGIRDIFSGYRIHACIVSVFTWKRIKELVWTGRLHHAIQNPETEDSTFSRSMPVLCSIKRLIMVTSDSGYHLEYPGLIGLDQGLKRSTPVFRVKKFLISLTHIWCI